MFHVVLYQPEIPPNTGNIIRLCANAGAQLHLIHPLGFELDEKKVRRAGLDYHDLTLLREHDNLDEFIQAVRPQRIFAYSTKGHTCYTEPSFKAGDALLFGPETRGLPTGLLARLPEAQVLRLPMRANSRSLNLSNTVAIALYEAWRQTGFVLD